MSTAFVDRRRELRALQTFYDTDRPGLLFLYGRRRVGKTALLSHWVDSLSAQPRPGRVLFWTATTQSATYQLVDFSRALRAIDPRWGTSPEDTPPFPSWEAAFRYLADLAEHLPEQGNLLVVMDEFTYLVQSDPDLVGVLQRVWDHLLSKAARVRLILSGSLVSVMESEVLSARAPLYGRGQAMRLRPLEFGALRELLPDWTPESRVAVFAVCGGIPAYLDLFARAGKFDRGLLEYGLAPNGVLLTDASLLLNERLDEPHVYESVLATIASGFHEWSEIAGIARVAETKLGHYLQTLQALELVERRQPVLAARGNRHGRYFVKDAFLRFYYRFVLPHRTAIQRGMLGRTVQTIVEDLRAFIGTYVFEELCRDWALIQADLGTLGWLPEEYGSYWRQVRGERVQLDVVAASRRDKRLLIGEVKWGTAPVGRSVLADLIARSQRMPEVAEGWRTEYVLFSRNGFTEATQALAHERGARLVTLAEVEAAHIRFVEGSAS